MAWLVFALGGALMLVGAAAIGYGAEFIDIERGWADVIAGTVAFSGGAVTLALACVVARLGHLQHALTDARAATDATAAAAEAADSAAAEAPGVPASAGPGNSDMPADPWRATVDDAAGPGEPGAVHADNCQPEHSGLTATPAEAASVGEPESHGPAATESALPVPRQTDAPSGQEADAPSGQEASADDLPPSSEGTGDKEKGAADQAAGEAALAESAAGDVMPPTSDTISAAAAYSVDWLERELTTLDAQFEDTPGAAEGEATDSAAARLKPRDRPGSKFQGRPAPAGRRRARTDQAATASPAVAGRYSAGGVSYVLFVDGSIEAETASGVFKFRSLGELKAFIEERNVTPAVP